MRLGDYGPGISDPFFGLTDEASFPGSAELIRDANAARKRIDDQLGSVADL